MTAEAAPATASTTSRPYTGPRCPSCGGPCIRWKGDVWGYTCTACINAHLAEAAARADEHERVDRQRMARKRREATP